MKLEPAGEYPLYRYSEVQLGSKKRGSQEPLFRHRHRSGAGGDEVICYPDLQ